MSWINDIFHKDKAIIGLCHLKALPNDPFYDDKAGMEEVFQSALHDVIALQNGGIDGIQFTNEFSIPYVSAEKADASTIAAMAVIIGRLNQLPIPGFPLAWQCRCLIRSS